MNPPQCRLLRDIPAGKTVRVHSLTADKAARARLCALGILPGTRLEVCDNCTGGGMRRIRVRGSSLVIGDCMAEGVECVDCIENDDHTHSQGMGFGRQRRNRGEGHGREAR